MTTHIQRLGGRAIWWGKLGHVRVTGSVDRKTCRLEIGGENGVCYGFGGYLELGRGQGGHLDYTNGVRSNS